MNELPDETKNPWLASRTRSGAEYDAPYEQRAQAGVDIHGEANLVEKLLQAYRDPSRTEPQSVLDGGCGTGRAAIELARRGYEVVGVDLDEVMLSQAKIKAPELQWHLADLSRIQLNRQFDAIVMAGNVMIYVTSGTELAVLKNMSSHLKPGGFLLAAFQLNSRPWSDLTMLQYESLAQQCGLMTAKRWSSWDQDNWQEGDGYLVSLHLLTP